MVRKLTVLFWFVFVHSSLCSRMRYEQPFSQQLYRNDQHYRNDPAIMHPESLYKRDHLFGREPLMQPEQLIPQQSLLRNEPMYGNEPIAAPQPVLPNEDFLQNDHIMQRETLMRNEAFLRQDPIVRREPIMRREPFIRGEPMMRNDRIFQSPQVIREEPIFRNQPSPYSVMLTPIPQEPQNFAPIPSQETFFPIQQPIQQQPIVAHRIVCQKPVIKPSMYQPIVTFPRVQRFVRKGFRPMQDNIQFTDPPVTTTQEFPSFNNDQVPFQGSFQNQAPPQENTSESTQSNAVTVRNVPQMPTPLNLAQMSSIC